MATKKPGKALVNWSEELAKRAAAAASKEKGGEGNWISTQGGVLKYQGAEVPKNQLDVVIIHSIHENKLYDGKFDANNPTPPICYAFGDDDAELVPHKDVEEPQGEICATCPMNEWGSGDGDGKACKNVRRLAVIPSSSLNDLAKAEVAYVSVPVTSVKAWKGYVRSLNDSLNKPPFAVVTRISLHRDSKTQFKMQFELIEEISDDFMEALFAANEKQLDAIQFPYPKASEVAERQPRGKPSKVSKVAKPAPQRGRR